MNRKVKRYDPISSDGTCGMCIEDADYGAYVEFADYAALEDECERLTDELAAERDALATELSALKAQQYPLPDELYSGSKDWAGSTYAGRVEWLHIMYESSKCEVAMLEEQALKAQQAGQEPVAYLVEGVGTVSLHYLKYPEWAHGDNSLTVTPLYTAPQPAPAQDVAGWIPVTERLPKVAQEVIVSTEFEGVCAGILDSYGEWFAPCSEYKLTRVTQWMPLPPAPEVV